MEKKVSVVKDDLKVRAPLASALFMGTGQFFCLKQRVRGAILFVAELLMLSFIIFGSRSIPYEELVSEEVTADHYVTILQEVIPEDSDALEAIAERNSALEALATENNTSVKYLEALAAENEDVESELEEINNDFKDKAYDLIEASYPAVAENLGVKPEDYDSEIVLEELMPEKVEALRAKQEKGMQALYKKYGVEDADGLDELAYGDDEAFGEEIQKQMDKLSESYYSNTLKILAKNYPATMDVNYDGCSVCKAAHKLGNTTSSHFAWFQGPVIRGIHGLITLGDAAEEDVPVLYRDHSIFLMIEGFIIFIFIVLFLCAYVYNIVDAKKTATKIVRDGCYPETKKANSRFWDRAFPFFALILPVLMICFFTIVPLLFSAFVAFTNYSQPLHIPPANTVDWVGMENFKTMFMSEGANSWTSAFGRVILWTVIWAFAATITCFVTGMIMAVILVDKRIKLSPVFRTIFIIPYAIPGMLSLFVWQSLLNGTFGPINRTLMELGLIASPIPFLSDPTWAKFTLIIVNIWLGFPYSMILVTSNMTAIPGQLYEAATIDGANKYQQFAKITVPIVLYQTMPLLIMQFAGNINNFGAVFFLTAGDPKVADTSISQAGATDLLISWVYKLTFNQPQQYNMASVIAILIFVVLVPFALFNFTRTKSFKEGEL